MKTSYICCQYINQSIRVLPTRTFGPNPVLNTGVWRIREQFVIWLVTWFTKQQSNTFQTKSQRKWDPTSLPRWAPIYILHFPLLFQFWWRFVTDSLPNEPLTSIYAAEKNEKNLWNFASEMFLVLRTC